MSTFALITCYSSMAICFGYILAVIIKNKGIPDSISSSYYLGWGWVFTAWAWLTGFLLLPGWLEMSGIGYQFLAFLSVISLIGVGCFPKFLEDDEVEHTLCACVCGGLALIWSWQAETLSITIPSIIIFSLLGFKLKKSALTFFLELAGFISIFLSILI